MRLGFWQILLTIGTHFAYAMPACTKVHVSSQVQRNIQAAKEALGLVKSETQGREDAVLREVEQMLKPVKNLTWPSGRPKNNELHV